MISISHLKSAAGAARYMTEQGRAEYYADGKVKSEWAGRGAEHQGLAGREVESRDLVTQLEGKVQEFNKATGKWEEVQLGVHRNGDLQHRAGWDLTFGAPKSVTLESEVWGHDDVRQAHEQAVEVAMRFLEEHAAQTRMRSGEFIKTGNLTYASFQHATTRDGDPQTHTHVLVANVTYLDGKAYSLSNERLLELRTSADSVYKNELANILTARGYEVQWDSKGNFEIAGYSRDNLDVFSKRSKDIQHALEERGMDKGSASYHARQVATLSTRREKEHVESAMQHRERWQAEAIQNGISQVQRALSNGMNSQQNAASAVQSALNHLTERELAFSDKDLWKTAMEFSQGRADLQKIAVAVRDQIEKGNLIQRTDGKFTTKKGIAAENHMKDQLSAGAGAHQAVMSEREFRVALAKFEKEKGFDLSKEQRDAAKMMLVGDDRFQGVQGLAGTGKTTMLQFVRQAAELKGWKIQGFSNGGAQAYKLQEESGISSGTTARFLYDFKTIEQDASLARKAIDTFERNSGPLGARPEWPAIYAGVKQGDVRVEFDSQRHAYYTDPEGNTWTKSLYESSKVVYKPNLNHLGLTDTKYVVSSKGVFKTGGTPIAELAGSIRELINKPGVIMDRVLEHFEQWQKCDKLEAAMIRAEAMGQSLADQNDALNHLKEIAAAAGGQRQKTLYIMDEASMAGQGEFNKVVRATDKSGSRVVFLGDSKQHQAVEAGTPFEIAQKHIPMSYLGANSIRRQTTEHARGAVASLLAGDFAGALNGLKTTEINSNQALVHQKYRGKDTTPDQRETYKQELKVAAVEDNKLVIFSMARDYSSMPREERDRTMIITSSNADRNAINAEIRENLKQQGDLKGEYLISTLGKTGLTKEQLKLSSTYEKGQVVGFEKDNKKLGISKGQEGKVIDTDFRTNSVSLEMNDGRIVTINPEKVTGTELYNLQENKGFAVGDRVTFGKNQDGIYASSDKTFNVRNGQTGVVEKFDGKNMTVVLDNGERRMINVESYKHVDHAYAITSYKSQGQTVDRAWHHHNTEQGRHGDRETYVNLTRVREEVKVYTQDAEKAARQAGVTLTKEMANIFSVGDRVAYDKNDTTMAGRTGVVEKVDGNALTLRMDNGDKQLVDVQSYRAELREGEHVLTQKSYVEQHSGVPDYNPARPDLTQESVREMQGERSRESEHLQDREQEVDRPERTPKVERENDPGHKESSTKEESKPFSLIDLVKAGQSERTTEAENSLIQREKGSAKVEESRTEPASDNSPSKIIGQGKADATGESKLSELRKLVKIEPDAKTGKEKDRDTGEAKTMGEKMSTAKDTGFDMGM